MWGGGKRRGKPSKPGKLLSALRSLLGELGRAKEGPSQLDGAWPRKTPLEVEARRRGGVEVSKLTRLSKQREAASQ